MKGNELVGKSLLIGYQTVQLDRAGETGTLVEHVAEVLFVDSTDTLVAVTGNGDRHLIPVGNVFAADSAYFVGSPDLIAVHEAYRDFDNARGLGLERNRWLDREQACEVLSTDLRPDE